MNFIFRDVLLLELLQCQSLGHLLRVKQVICAAVLFPDDLRRKHFSHSHVFPIYNMTQVIAIAMESLRGGGQCVCCSQFQKGVSGRASDLQTYAKHNMAIHFI